MRQYAPLALTVPARTAQNAPVSASWVLYPGWVHHWRIDVPLGHNGLTGVRIVYNQTPIAPFHPTLFFVGSGHTFTVPYEDEIQDTGLVVQGFNTDAFPHTFRLWADVNPYGQHGAIPGVVMPSSRFVPASTHDAIAALARTGSRP